MAGYLTTFCDEVIDQKYTFASSKKMHFKTDPLQLKADISFSNPTRNRIKLKEENLSSPVSMGRKTITTLDGSACAKNRQRILTSP